MNHILNILFGWIPQAGFVLSFFTPERCKALVGMVGETIDYANDLKGADSWNDIYNASLEYACDLYDKWDEAEKYDQGIDNFVKNTVFPLILGFVFGGNDNGQ